VLLRRYILVYPQGCDVCNHLSLFLCVADYDKLLPGAQPRHHAAQAVSPQHKRQACACICSMLNCTVGISCMAGCS
jgi:hypothetical protein